MTLLENLRAGATFTPSTELIRACEVTLTCEAHVETLRPIVVGYQKEILEAGNFHICADMQEARKRGKANPRPTRILDPEDSFMMSKADFEVYHAACQQAASDANLKVSKPDNCPLLEAGHLLIKAQNALLEVFANEMGSPRLAHPVMMDDRKRLLQIIYGMVVPHISTADEILQELVA